MDAKHGWPFARLGAILGAIATAGVLAVGAVLALTGAREPGWLAGLEAALLMLSTVVSVPASLLFVQLVPPDAPSPVFVVLIVALPVVNGILVGALLDVVSRLPWIRRFFVVFAMAGTMAVVS